MQGKMRQDLYQELFEVEDHHWWHQHKRAIVHKLLDRFCKPGKLIDVGAGTGKILSELQLKKWQVFGIDGEQEASHLSKLRGVKVKLLDLTLNKLPFADNSFDAALSLDIIEHLPDDVGLISEIYRILKPGAILIITVPAYQWLFSYWDKMLGHKRRYTVGSLRLVCHRSKLQPLYSSYFFSAQLLPAAVVRLIKSLLGQKATNFSDFKSTPIRSISEPLISLYSKLEQFLITTTALPFGLSVVAVTQKR